MTKDTVVKNILACIVRGGGGAARASVRVCGFVVICYHILIRQTAAPESLGGRQESRCWFQVPGSSGIQTVVRTPTPFDLFIFILSYLTLSTRFPLR